MRYMITITNLTNKTISVNENVKVSPYDAVTIDYAIDNRLYQLSLMGLISIRDVSSHSQNNDQVNNHTNALSLKRQATMNKVRNGEIQQTSLPLDKAYNVNNNLNTNIKRKKVKK